MTHPLERSRAGAGTIAAAAAILLWGVGSVLAKTTAVQGLALAFHRMWLGSLVALAVVFATGRRLTVRGLRYAVEGGLVFGLNIVLFFTAVKITTVANATVIGALQPVLALLVAGPLFGERVRASALAWTAVAIAGVGIVVFGSSGTPVWSPRGDFLAAGALVTFTWYFVAAKRARRHVGALEYQAALSIVAAVALAPVAVLSGQDLGLSARDWWGVAGVVVVPGGGHLLMNWAHAYAPLSLTSRLTLGIPVVSTAVAAVVLDESVVALQVLGMAVVVASLAVVVGQADHPVPVELPEPGPEIADE